jgi:hypothetical protein
MSFDLFANGFDRSVGAQETIGQGFIFAQESEKQVLRLDIGRPELAGFVACEKDDAPGFLRIAFKHNALPPDFPGRENVVRPTYRTRSLILPTLFYRHYAIKGPQNQSTETFFQTFDHVTEGTVANRSL